MILVLGTHEDDILYFVNRMIITEEIKIANRTKVYVGDYSRQQIAVSYTGHTMMLASLITGLLIEKYRPYLIINIGMAHSISPKLKQGDLFLAERIYLGQVDMTPLSGRLKFGQVPGASIFSYSDDMCLHILETHNNREANKKMVRGFLLSNNMMLTDQEEIKQLTTKYPAVDEVIAMDTEAGGVTVAAQFYDIPVVCLKAIVYEVGNKKQFISRDRVGVEMTPIIGSLVGNLFFDLASNDQQI